MKIKEFFEKIRDKIILKKEIKCARRMMLESSENKEEPGKEKSIKVLKINREKLKEARFNRRCNGFDYSGICQFF